MQYKALEGPLSLWTQSAHRPQCYHSICIQASGNNRAHIRKAVQIIVQIAELIVNPLDLTHLTENSQLSRIGQ